MKRILAVVSLCLIFTMVVSSVFAASDRRRVPRVVYLAPDNDTVIDLTGKPALRFEWKGQPVPGGGRKAVRFRVYKGFSYEVVDRQDLGRDVFSAEVPSDKFEDGQLYSWHVEQRDGSTMAWSLHDTWSFTVKKK